jgi:hypothetical protein
MNVLELTSFESGQAVYVNPSQMMHWKEIKHGALIVFSDGSIIKVSDTAKEISECIWEAR